MIDKQIRRVFGNNGKDLYQFIKNKEFNKARYIIEDTLDDDSLYDYNNLTENGHPKVKDSRRGEHKRRLELYSSFMELLNNYLDDRRRVQTVKSSISESTNSTRLSSKSLKERARWGTLSKR